MQCSTKPSAHHFRVMVKLIISVNEARKLLGKTAVNLSDEEVEKIIIDLNYIAKHAIKDFRENKYTTSAKDATPDSV